MNQDILPEKVTVDQRRLWVWMSLLVVVVLFYLLLRIARGGEVRLSSSPNLTPGSSNTVTTPSGGQIFLAGTVMAAGKRELPATHQLVDVEGKVIAWLTSRKIDLNFTVPGMTVEVSGKVLKKMSDGQPLLQVESLRYRKNEEAK